MIESHDYGIFLNVKQKKVRRCKMHTQENTNDGGIRPTPAHFQKCTSCNTVHIVREGLNDYRPTCKQCGGINFEPAEKGVAGYMPEFCDHNLDKRIWDGTMAVILGPIHSWKNEIEEKYGIEFSKNDIQDLASAITTVSKAMVSVDRTAFDSDAFVNRQKSVFRSYLYYRRRQKPTNNR